MRHKKFAMDGYNLHTLVTDRFKTIALRIDISILGSKDNIIYFPLLWRMLVQTSSKYDSIEAMNEACANIYDPSYSIGHTESGNVDILSLSAGFANEKYTEKGMTNEVIKFLSHFIFEPKIINSAFDSKMFEIQKNKLIDDYKSIKDYPREYVRAMLKENMSVRDYKNYTLKEVISKTEKVTSEELYSFYKMIMEDGNLDIFVCGNFDPESIKKIFEKIIVFNGKKKKLPHTVKQISYNKKPKLVIESSNNVQSSLIIGCKATNITDYERDYVGALYSSILGGGMQSLLNQTVREKHSLCYYIYSGFNGLIDVMNIYAGINKSDYNKTYQLIKKEMKNIADGNFPDELINSVKSLYYDSLIGIEDYQGDMLESYISQVYTNFPSVSSRKKMIKKVSKEDIMGFASKVHIDTICFLEGDGHE